MKPTVTTMLQPALTIWSMLVAKSEVVLDCASFCLTPSWATASVRPLWEVWLKDLSSKPPASETMQAVKSEAGAAAVEAPPAGADGAAVFAGGGVAQPASSRAAARPEPMRDFFT